MATLRQPIVGWNTMPDGTGECYFEPFSILATNDVWKHIVCRFGTNNAAQPTVRHGFYGAFMVPKDYVGTAVLVINWSATLTSGNVAWDFEYRAVGGNDTESLDQTGTQESVSVTDAAASAANEKLEVTVNLTSANFAADDLVTFFFARDGADAADTMAGSALLHSLHFQYNDA
jgi:hypothetical protein